MMMMMMMMMMMTTMMVPKDLMIWTMFVAKRVNLILQNDDHESLVRIAMVIRRVCGGASTE